MIRIIDLTVSITTILLLSPLLILVMFVLKFTGEGAIFYRQSRVGQFGAEFKILKFATMLKDSPNIGTGTVTVKGDPRILPFGGLLRKTKLNELPQLINIIIGDMSLIGPRPQTPRCFNAFPEDLQSSITSLKPGLSGVGSIVFRNEEALLDSKSNPVDFYDNVIMPYKAELEVWYGQHYCFSIYLKCILSTIFAVLNPKSKHNPIFLSNLPKPPESLGLSFQRDERD